MLESFVASQKLSVQKALRRKFRRYLAAAADYNGLVLLKLQVAGCVRSNLNASDTFLPTPAHN